MTETAHRVAAITTWQRPGFREHQSLLARQRGKLTKVVTAIRHLRQATDVAWPVMDKAERLDLINALDKFGRILKARSLEKFAANAKKARGSK
jgi:hypothetical protein